MLRSLFCAAAIFVLVLSVCLLPQTAAARRCPVKEPETLLSLYQNSDAIYVGTFDKIIEGEVVETNDDYSVKEINKHFTISSTLKGENRKFFVLEDREYTYKNAESELPAETVIETETVVEAESETAEEPEYEEEEDEDSAELKSGDTLLLFVKNGNEEEGPTLADYRDGIKQLSMEHIGVYEARIKDLNAIFSAKKVSEARLLEWLIRCAEDPVTRWEGTFELMKSVRNQEWQQQAAERRKERLAKGEPVEEGPLEIDVEQEVLLLGKNVNTNALAKMLDINHKQTLANILLNNHGSAGTDGERSKPVAGDRELIELVKRWGDPRLVAFLMDKLRAGSDDSSFTADMMTIIAEILDDEEAAAVAEKYSENAYEADEDVVEADEEEDTEQPERADESDEGKPAGTETDEAETADEPAADDQEAADNEPAAKKQTYKELRAELLRKFLAQCEKSAAQKEKEKEERSAR